jgi:hypothetical protein
MSDFLDNTRRPVFHLKQCFGDWTVPPSSGNKSTHSGPIDRASLYRVDKRMEAESSLRNVLNKNQKDG